MNLDQDFTEADIYTIMQKQNSKTISEELVLKSKPGNRWQWTTGVSGFYQWLKTDGPVTFQEAGIQSLIEDNINAGLSHLPAGAPTLAAKITTRPLPVSGVFDTPILNGAIYHQSTINDVLVEGLSVTAGLRLDYEKLKLDYNSVCDMNFDFSVSAPFLPTAIVRQLNAKTQFIGKESTDYLQLLPKFTIQYAWNRKNNVYATVSKGYRSGGYNIQMFSDLLQASLKNDMMRLTKDEIMSQVPENLKDMVNFLPDAGENPDARAATVYKPEQTWNYEIGTHLNLFQNRLRADAALFWLETRDQQISRFAQSGLGRETVNAGKSRSLGAEISLMGAVTTNFTLTASYGYTYATFKDYITTNSKLEEISYNGNYVPFVPKHTLSLGGQYIFRINPGHWLDRIQLNANYTGAGRIYWTEQNDISQAFYGTLNGRLSLQKGNGQIDFWVRNALDKDYAAFYFESMGNGFMQKGRPIQAGIELRCRF